MAGEKSRMRGVRHLSQMQNLKGHYKKSIIQINTTLMQYFKNVSTKMYVEQYIKTLDKDMTNVIDF